MTRLPATCAAIRKARVAALDIAIEADADGRHGIARALRRKAASAHPRDWHVVHAPRYIEARVSAYGVTAIGRSYRSGALPDDAERMLRAALALTMR